jgi:SPP1 gp7 family putative phage head morphogenesis protein
MVPAIAQTTRDAIKATVADALANDEGTPEIARRLLGLYRHWASPDDSAITVPRAYLIARTEVGRAASFGTWEGARQASEELGITIERTWITSRDDRVRDEHQALDGETVGLDEAFSNGRHYPDEPNCRCDVQQHVRRT